MSYLWHAYDIYVHYVYWALCTILCTLFAILCPLCNPILWMMYIILHIMYILRLDCQLYHHLSLMWKESLFVEYLHKMLKHCFITQWKFLKFIASQMHLIFNPSELHIYPLPLVKCLLCRRNLRSFCSSQSKIILNAIKAIFNKANQGFFLGLLFLNLNISDGTEYCQWSNPRKPHLFLWFWFFLWQLFLL